ncbi:MAG TPA: N-6 DNA methylase, partial [bacterium]|nr:N-6 DNA methylase [bacterium]
MPPSTPATDATRRALLQALAAWQATHRPPRPNDPAQLTFFAADSPAACGSDTEGLPAPLANALGAGSVRELGALLETHHQRSLPITVRKRQGQFCTPPSLVDSVLRTALGALELGPHSTLHVLEPAAGFGAFAAATLDLCGASGRACELTTVEQDPLAGAVLDALCAVAIAEHPGIPLRHHALAGDFLLDDLDLVPGSFDLVIGNPPYVASYARQAHALGDGVRERLRARYRFARGRLNSAVCFLERALELLRPGGVLAFVLPSALFNMKSWAELRAWLVDAHELVQVRYCGEGAFRAEVPVGVLVVRKGSDHPGFFPTPRLVEVVRDSPASSVLCPPALFHRFPGTIFNPHVDTGALAFLDRMEQGTIPLGVLVEIRDGINPANLAPILISRTPQTPQHRRLVRGGDIAPYRVTWNGEWVWYDRAAIAAKAGEGGYGFLREEWIFQAPVKLIHRQTADKLVAAVDCVQLYV